MVKFEIYTDGSCKGNGKKESRGGWGYLVLRDGEKVMYSSYGEKNTTNNRMEMKALIHALQDFEKCFGHEIFTLQRLEPVQVYTDSAYIHNCIMQRWYKSWMAKDWVNSKKEPVKNRDLWEQLIPYFDKPGLRFNKVKGHADNEYNNMVDELAQFAADKK